MTGTKDQLLRPAADVAGWVSFAASPTFALMAWLSAVNTSVMMECSAMPVMMECSAMSQFARIDSMALMYLLMSLFHLPPWLKLLFRRFTSPRQQTDGD